MEKERNLVFLTKETGGGRNMGNAAKLLLSPLWNADCFTRELADNIRTCSCRKLSLRFKLFYDDRDRVKGQSR